MAESGEAAPAGAAVGTWAPERRIAVAVDEGEESVYALRWCLCHVLPVNAHNSTVILLYARPPPPVYPSLDGTDSGRKRHGSYDIEANFVPNLEMPDTGYNLFSDGVIATMEKYSTELADSVMERAKRVCRDYTHIKVEARVATGDARDVICDMVEKVGADLLVMGSHGYGFIRRALLGSVSDYCAHHALCPVLIVKRP